MRAFQLPKDWSSDKLEKLTTRILDGTHATPSYQEYGIPFYSVESITNNDFTNTKYISNEDHQKLIKRCKPEKGDILMTRIGSIGDTKLIDWDVNASIYVSLALIKPNEKIDTNYLYNYTKFFEFKRELYKRTLQNAVPQKINLSEISKVEIRYPKSLEEQKKIVDILSTWDSAIELRERLIRRYESKMKTSYSEVYDNLKTNKEYKISTLAQIAKINKGKQLSRIDMDYLGEYPVINGGVLPSGLTTEWNTKENTISLSEGGNSCGYVNFIREKFWSGGHCYTLELKSNNIDKYFLYHYLKFKQKRIMALRVGSGLPNIQKSDISKFAIPLIDINKQKTIGNSFELMLKQIELIKTELRMIKLQKKGLMQQLLTGKIRVQV